MKGSKTQTAVFASIGLAAVCGMLALRAVAVKKARREKECVALTKALDKTIRERTPRAFESIVEHRWDDRAQRCLAALEYHYKPCDKATLKKNPELCSGPDADVAIYAFLDGGARPLLICERTYATGAASCSQSVYGSDGTVLASQDVPPEQYQSVKASLLGLQP